MIVRWSATILSSSATFGICATIGLSPSPRMPIVTMLLVVRPCASTPARQNSRSVASLVRVVPRALAVAASTPRWARIIGSWCEVPITMPYSSASCGVLGIVLVEGVAPHRRPEVVALQAQDQLEDVLVELVIEAAELLARPAAERRRLVVDEDAAVLHRRARPANVRARLHVQRVVLLTRERPPTSTTATRRSAPTGRRCRRWCRACRCRR